MFEFVILAATFILFVGMLVYDSYRRRRTERKRKDLLERGQQLVTDDHDPHQEARSIVNTLKDDVAKSRKERDDTESKRDET
jgi:hypothetical protein